MTSCKFCSAELQPELISGLVVGQERTDTAYNSASKLRILAGAMWAFFFLSFLPFFGFVLSWAFYVIAVLIPILLIVWYVKYGDLKTLDPEFKTAKKYLYTAFFIWLIYPALLFVITIVVTVGVLALKSK
ncbi:MAG: hypothetical protein ABJA02_13655 [Acidobacteriota bacterium]